MAKKIHVTYEFDSEDELRAHFGVDRAANAPSAAPEPTVSADALDADGMPYDGAVHADPPSHTADGRWRAKRGKADEAKAAREAFLAKGGAVTPPADLPPEPPLASPVAVSGVPGIPGMAALPPSAPEPVTIERLYAAISEAMTANPALDMRAVYQEYAGTTDMAALGNVLNTNESVRAAIMRHLESL